MKTEWTLTAIGVGSTALVCVKGERCPVSSRCVPAEMPAVRGEARDPRREALLQWVREVLAPARVVAAISANIVWWSELRGRGADADVARFRTDRIPEFTAVLRALRGCRPASKASRTLHARVLSHVERVWTLTSTYLEARETRLVEASMVWDELQRLDPHVYQDIERLVGYYGIQPCEVPCG